jgi:hypothetical protein
MRKSNSGRTPTDLSGSSTAPPELIDVARDAAEKTSSISTASPREEVPIAREPEAADYCGVDGGVGDVKLMTTFTCTICPAATSIGAIVFSENFSGAEQPVEHDMK